MPLPEIGPSTGKTSSGYEPGRSSRHHPRSRAGGLQRGRLDQSSLHSGSRRRICGEFNIRASTAIADQNLGSFPATATISQQKSGVSIVVVPEQGGTFSFSFSGTVLPGGAVTLEDEAGVSFLTLQLPQCDFTGAEITSKAFPRDGRLVITADITGAVCPWHESNGAFVPTTFTVRYEGTTSG